MSAKTNMSSDDTDKYRAPALDKGLDIIELLATTEEGMSQAEIGKALDRTPNEIFRMLDRLVRRAYVRRTSEDRYELTLKLFELAHQRRPLNRLVRSAMPVMKRFALASEQAIHLVIQDRSVLVAVAQVDGPGYWNVSVRVGSRINLINTGSGHVFLAYASPEERALMATEQNQDESQVITPELERHFQVITKRGYEKMKSAQVAGVWNISVPVLGPLGSVIAVLTCPFTERMDKPTAPSPDQVLQLALDAGNELTQHR